jgi:hypothetical protein
LAYLLFFAGLFFGSRDEFGARDEDIRGTGIVSKQKKPWVAASDVGSSQYCQKSFELRESGIKPSTEAQVTMDVGTQNHVQLNQSIKYKEYRARQRDSRCFVASQVYGFDHPKTNALREWRDNYLMTNLVGRLLVAIYYKLSPMLVSICRKLPLVDKLSRKAVDSFMSLFGIKEK